ncbi:uncharacterized protein LOC123721806 [Papilio machaon]|uniref:uncharacterized protein LOC123721806 n=1 Tax=Papilio machaon TaxID=76193 RepID=UPI001E665375|nr:uncharacterized protein LOC123721806 [Papilio machaon]
MDEEVPWCILYADDIMLVGKDECEVQSRLEKWRDKLQRAGLKISRTKTEHLFCDFGGPTSFSPIALNGVDLPTCYDFKYLGWRLDTGVTCDPRMSPKLKGQIYKSIVRPVVLYGSECWVTKVLDERRLRGAGGGTRRRRGAQSPPNRWTATTRRAHRSSSNYTRQC